MCLCGRLKQTARCERAGVRACVRSFVRLRVHGWAGGSHALELPPEAAKFLHQTAGADRAHSLQTVWQRDGKHRRRSIVVNSIRTQQMLVGFTSLVILVGRGSGDRGSDIETERQRDGGDGETERQRDRETERRRDGETERRRDRETETERARE